MHRNLLRAHCSLCCLALLPLHLPRPPRGFGLVYSPTQRVSILPIMASHVEPHTL